MSINMCFVGDIIIENTPNDKITIPWSCNNIKLPFVPQRGTTIVLSESSRSAYQDLYVKETVINDDFIYVIFEDIVYYSLHATIPRVINELHMGLDKLLRNYNPTQHKYKPKFETEDVFYNDTKVDLTNIYRDKPTQFERVLINKFLDRFNKVENIE